MRTRTLISGVLILFVIGSIAKLQTVIGAGVFYDNFETGNITNWSSSYVESGNLLEVIGAAAAEGSYGLCQVTLLTMFLIMSLLVSSRLTYPPFSPVVSEQLLLSS